MQLNENQVRRAFEHWFSDAGQTPKAIEKSSNGNYKLMQASAAWIAFYHGYCAAVNGQLAETQAPTHDSATA